MKASVISALLLTGLAAAAPLTEKRMARRAAGVRHSNYPTVPNTNGEKLNITNSANVQYSSNWAGAALVGTGYSGITAQFTVPTPSAPGSGRGGGSEQYCAAAWVGLDGDTCETSILQTGVDFCIEGGEVSYDAWYEWYPDYAYDFSGITISAGDVIKLTITATSKTGGTAEIEDVTTGVKVTHSFSGESDALCEYNAEWIVEDFEEGDSMVPFADFGTVTFSDAAATQSGSSVDTSGAQLMDIQQGNSVLTSVSSSGSTVTVKYV